MEAEAENCRRGNSSIRRNVKRETTQRLEARG